MRKTSPSNKKRSAPRKRVRGGLEIRRNFNVGKSPDVDLVLKGHKSDFSDGDIEALAEEYRDKHGFDPCCVHAVEYEPPKKVTLQGRVKHVLYKSRKDFEGDAVYLFDHEFEGKIKPYYATGDGHHVFVGGGYTVTPHGIEDDEKNKHDIRSGEFYEDLNMPSKMAGMGEMKYLVIEDINTGKEREVHIPGCILAYARLPSKRYQLYIVKKNPIARYKRQ